MIRTATAAPMKATAAQLNRLALLDEPRIDAWEDMQDRAEVALLRMEQNPRRLREEMD